MIKLFSFIFVLFAGFSIKAQSFDHVVSFGFDTRPQALCTLTNERFLVAGRGEFMPGDFNYSDTVFAMIFNASGQVEQRLILPAPANETHHVNHVIGTPDGGFVVSLSATNCDVAPGAGSALLGYDSAGVLRWNRVSSDFPPDLPRHLEITPDGQLLGILKTQLIGLDYMTGATLWETNVNATGSPFSFILDLDFIPGSWDFVAKGAPHRQVWRHLGPLEEHNYYLDFSQNGTVFESLAATPEGFFGLDEEHGLIRFDESGEIALYNSPDLKWLNFTKADNGFWLHGRAESENWLLKITTEGQVTDTLVFGNAWLWGREALLTDGVLIAAGTGGSGPKSVLGQGDYNYQTRHLWLHTAYVDAPESLISVNAALTSVEQLTPLQLSVYVEQFPPTDTDTLYSIQGGNFRVQVSNTGSVTLHHADVMIAFDWSQTFFECGIKPAFRRHYDNLNLAPGESIWLDFGDIEANYQLNLPAQFCFWTAAPNGQPDADHSDDTFCYDYTIPAPEPVAAGALRISPNPAGAEGFWVERTDEVSEPLVCKLFDATGRLVACERMAPGISRLHFSTAHLPPGLYYCEAGYWRGKLVVGR